PHLHSFPTRRSSDLSLRANSHFGSARFNGASRITVTYDDCSPTGKWPAESSSATPPATPFSDRAIAEPAGPRTETTLVGELTTRSEEHTSELQSRFD